MFESILLRRSGEVSKSLDIGDFAEALLYYGTVHIHLDMGVLAELGKGVGLENLNRLVANGWLRATYMPQFVGTQTNLENGIPINRFIVAEKVGSEKRGRLSRKEVFLEVALQSARGAKGALRQAKKLVDSTPILSKSASSEFDKVAKLATEDLKDQKFVQLSVTSRLRALVPKFSVPTHWYFRAILLEKNEFLVDTNFDFEALNKALKVERPDLKVAITPALLVTLIIDARAHMHFAGEYGSDIYTSSSIAPVIQSRVAGILRPYQRSQKEIELFQEMTLDSGFAIGDTLRSGERTFDDFMEVLDRANKFKDWLRAANPDVGLVKEYQQAISRETWMEKIPTKAVRFFAFTGAGLGADFLLGGAAGTLSGIGVGAADSLLLDRLIKGWKPSQFVSQELASFTKNTR